MHNPEETLRQEIAETKSHAEESWLHVRCSKMLDALGVLKVEHARALASARAEGFAKAREMATALAEESVGREIASRPTWRFARNMSEARELALAALADDIRAMQDEGAVEPPTAPLCECGHDKGWHHYGKRSACMKKMEDRTTCVCMAWRPVGVQP